MSTKLGAIVKFREGVTEEQAMEALHGLSEVLDLHTFEALQRGKLIEEYDPDFGEPVWYIP